MTENIRGGLPWPTQPRQSSTLSKTEVDQLAHQYYEVLTDARDFINKSADFLSGNVMGPDGAPVLGAPAQMQTGANLMMLLESILGKIKDLQMKSAQQGIKFDKAKLDEMHARAKIEMENWSKKLDEAAEKQKQEKMSNWIGQIFGFIGALIGTLVAGVLTVMSGGAAAPLLVGAIMGLASATVSLANTINQELHPGAEPISISGAIAKSIANDLIAKGVDPKEAKKQSEALLLAVTMASGGILAVLDPGMVGTAWAGIAKLAGADENQAAIMNAVVSLITGITTGIMLAVVSGGAAASGLAKIGDIAKAISMSGQVASIAGSVAQGGASIAAGSYKIEAADMTEQAENFQADNQRTQAQIDRLMQMLEKLQDELKKLFEELQSGYQITIACVQQESDMNMKLVKNIRAQGG